MMMNSNSIIYTHLIVTFAAHHDEVQADQIQILKTQGFVNTGDVVINTGSTPIQLHLPTNIIKINKVD